VLAWQRGTEAVGIVDDLVGNGDQADGVRDLYISQEVIDADVRFLSVFREADNAKARLPTFGELDTDMVNLWDVAEEVIPDVD